MIQPNDIERILELDIYTIIAPYVQLKKKGVNYTGCCPFHDEKTPSFMVSSVKGIYKCFGCGKGGNGISFVMERENLLFPQAVKKIATDHNIKITEEELTPEQIQANEQHELKRNNLVSANKTFADWAYNNLYSEENKQALEYLQNRINEPEIWKLFSVGFAPDGWQNYCNYLKSNSLSVDFALSSGIIKDKEGKQYDFFRNRIIIPIFNEVGLLVGFTGRYIGTNKDEAKYLNTPETEIFTKGNVWFGLFQARNDIKRRKVANIVEGNIDVIKLHYLGISNTICSGGTEIADTQIKKLERYCNEINLIADGDAAGQKSLVRNGLRFVENGFQVNIIPLPFENGIKSDPDSFFTSSEHFDEYSKKTRVDFIHYYAKQLIDAAGSNAQLKSNAIDQIVFTLTFVKSGIAQSIYIEVLSKNLKISKKLLQQELNKRLEENAPVTEAETNEVPAHIDAIEAKKFGFYADKNRYYFFTKDGPVPGSNFILNPLFHIYSKSDNKRLIEVVNEWGFSRIVDIPSKSFVSFEQFQSLVYQEGNYLFFGTKQQFVKILSKISNDFPTCHELKTLGWQREGFFAFANGIFNEKWVPVDKFGITTHDEQMYFSPAFSMIYKDVREDDDEYENDRFFIYQQSRMKFTEWATLIRKVYGDQKGIIGIAFFIASLFRDIIYEKYKIFPHLFLFGEKQSGKSQLGWSLSNIFLNGQPAFNLSSGTNVGFFRRLARFRNSIVWYDEYTNDIDEKRFQALKAAYDGVGHEKGKMSKDNRTEITKIVAASIVSGQYLPTRDDNALFTRSILLSFVKKQYTQEEIENFDELKKAETQGLSSIITEILPLRDEIDKFFGREFSDIFETLKTDLLDNNIEFDERLVRNFTTIMAPIRILLNSSLRINPAFTYNELYTVCRDLIAELSAKISSSEALSNFWKLVEYMLDSGDIKYGDDFKIVKLSAYQTFMILGTGHKTQPKHFEQETELLYIRFTKIHPLYMEYHRKMHGSNGIDLTSLQHYISTNKAYIGISQSTKFTSTNTSAYIFLNAIIPANLKREGQNNDSLDDKEEISADDVYSPTNYTKDEKRF